MKLICGIRTVGMNPKTRKEDKVHAHVYLFLFSLCLFIDYMFIFLMVFSSYFFLALAYLVIGGNPTPLQSILVCINYCCYMYILKIKAKLYTFNYRNEGIVVTYLSATLL